MPSPFTTRFRSRRFLSSVPHVLLFLLLFTASAPAAADENAEPLDGASLYALHCASCHRPLEKTNLYVGSVSRIRSAIDHLAIMYDLRDLSDAEVRAIAGALAEATP